MHDGQCVVVLDASVIHHLSADRNAEAVRSNCRAARLRIWPTFINAVEALKNRNPRTQERLLRALEEWLGDRPLLPWPMAVLQAAGKAALRGASTFPFEACGIQTLAIDADSLLEDHERACELLQPIDRIFEEAHRENGRTLRAAVKRGGMRDALQDPIVFLSEVWGNPENLEYQAQSIWMAFELPGSAPGDLLKLSEPWRLMIDCLGAAIYFRSVRTEAQARPASMTDILQIVSLSVVADRRIFVTNDVALRETAKLVLDGRYVGARVLTGDELCAN